MPVRAHRRKTESSSELETSSEHIEQVVQEKPRRRSSAMMLQLVIPPPPPPEDPDFYLSPTTKKKKNKKKLKNKNKSDVDDSEHGTPLTPGILTPGDTGSAKDSKKKKRTKKLRYDSAALGVIIIPDCDDGVVVDYDKDIEKIGGSAHFSTYTEQTSVMGDDDFTEATDEKKLERTPKKEKCPKSPKRDKKKGERRKSRRCSVKAQPKKDGGENVNEKWGADPNSDKTFMAPELLNLLMDPAMQVGDSDAEKSRSRSGGGLKKSTSFNGRKKSSRMSSARRSSVGCSLDIAGIEKLTKTRRHSKSRRKQKDPSASKNATWGSSEPATTSYSPELLNLYSAKKKEPSPMLTRNAKSFGVFNEMRRSSQSSESDIPSILFLSPENSVNTNESWSLHSKQSTGKQRKGSGMAAYDSMDEDEDDEVNDITRQGTPLPFQRRKSTDSNKSRGSSGSRGIGKSVSMMMQNSGISQGRRGSSMKRNESWGGDRGPVSNKPPMPLSRRGSGISNNGNELPLSRRGSGISNNGNELPLSRRGSNISNNGNELPLPRRGSNISNNGNELPLPRRGSNISNNGGNDSWTVSPGAGIAPMVSPRTSPKMSPQLMGLMMSDTSPGGSALRTKSQRKKSPGSLRKSTSMGGIRNSPSMNGIRNSFANFKKMRGIKENEKILGIPNLAN